MKQYGKPNGVRSTCLTRSRRRRWHLWLVVGAGLGLLSMGPGSGSAPEAAVIWPWNPGAPWPATSTRPVVRLAHANFEQVVSDHDLSRGFAFAVWGDQRAMADGEWQDLVALVDRVAEQRDDLLFVVDTGDIVYRGDQSDQFHMLAQILSPLQRLPYLVGVGNHELRNLRPGPARAHTATFLGYLDPQFGPDRMYYRKDAGPARLLFLDTNRWVYPPDGAIVDRDQLAWLAEQLREPEPAGGATIVVMHHPLVQSSRKHWRNARDLWNLEHQGRRLADLLADGGVDLVLTGHTHTYEHFRLRRDDGRGFELLNVSGRPRAGVLWFGGQARRANDLRGREELCLSRRGWEGLDRWEIEQVDAMLGRQANQFALVTVGPGGRLSWEVRFLDR